jgi:hypothetical protein
MIKIKTVIFGLITSLVLVFGVILTPNAKTSAACPANATCDCITYPCCSGMCEGCCGRVQCKYLTDEEVAKFPGKHK